VLVLALDTATPAVTAGVVALTPDAAPDPAVTCSVRVVQDARKHGELLLPGVLAACADAGVELRDVDAVVVGTGPGPFTGLRVGMVTAAALGDALDIPVHGVCSLDAIAAEAAGDPAVDGPLLVVTDARRREVYWAAYDATGARTTGPHVETPAALADRLPELGVTAAAGACAEGLGLPVVPPAAPGPAGLVACAVEALRTGARPAPLEPLYLRRPDAVAPGPRKPVTAKDHAAVTDGPAR
jgi:tRNA threonylcarbamoyl adenosine modification protein YeaZ